MELLYCLLVTCCSKTKAEKGTSICSVNMNGCVCGDAPEVTVCYILHKLPEVLNRIWRLHPRFSQHLSPDADYRSWKCRKLLLSRASRIISSPSVTCLASRTNAACFQWVSVSSVHRWTPGAKVKLNQKTMAVAWPVLRTLMGSCRLWLNSTSSLWALMEDESCAKMADWRLRWKMWQTSVSSSCGRVWMSSSRKVWVYNEKMWLN